MRASSLPHQPSLQRIVDLSLLALLLFSFVCVLSYVRASNTASQDQRQEQLARAEALLQQTLKQQRQMLITEAALITTSEDIETHLKHLLSLPADDTRPALLLLNHASGKPILGDIALSSLPGPGAPEEAFIVLNQTLYHSLHVSAGDAATVLTIGTPMDASTLATLNDLSGAHFSLTVRRQQRTLLALAAASRSIPMTPHTARAAIDTRHVILHSANDLHSANGVQVHIEIELAPAFGSDGWLPESIIASILLLAVVWCVQWWLRRREQRDKTAFAQALNTVITEINTPPASEPTCQFASDHLDAAAPEPELPATQDQDALAKVATLRASVERREQAIWRQSLHDPLTELPNCRSAPHCVQNLLNDDLAQPTVLICLDIQNFRLTNDAFGHHVGDCCLQQVGGRLRTLISEHCLAARLRGDEFLLAVRLIRPLGHTIHQTLAILQAPYIVEELALELRFRVGAAMYPNHTDSPLTLIQYATIALDHARAEDQQIVFYEPQMEEDHLHKLKRLEDLKHALADDEAQLQLHYQPKIATTPQADPLRFEALIRWHHPTAGFIAPDQFIPLAEQAGLIHTVTDWVIRQVIKQISAWNDAGHPVRVAINLSAKDLARPHLLNLINELLAEYSVEPHQLSFEITESELMRRPDEALALLHAFRDQGFELAIDDFGTGYSSLAQLKHMPITELKIDKSFVMELDQHPEDQIIVQSTVQLAHSFNIGVVAEGVENEQSLSLLRRWGCNWAQGYFISRPLPANAVPEFIQAYRNNTNFQAGCSG